MNQQPITATTNIRLSYREDIGLNGKNLYTPKKWKERFQHYIKRIYKVDVKQILVDDMTPTRNPWDTKEPEIGQDFIWGAALSATKYSPKENFIWTQIPLKLTN